MSYTFELHDWEITGVKVVGSERSIHLTLMSPSGTDESTLELEGVEGLYCAGMGMQNVVLDCMVLTADSLAEDLRYCYEKLKIGPEVFSGLQPRYILLVEPSAGMEFICTFESARLSQ